MKIAIRKILGVLTDALNYGRKKGWWSKGQEPNVRN